MINYIKSDLYRILTRWYFYIQCLALSVIPPYVISSLHGTNPAETVLPFIPSVILMTTYIMAIIITDYTFREDMQLGLFKNDTTNGTSRTGIYLGKMVSGFLLLLIFSAICSLTSVLSTVYFFDLESGLMLLKNMLTLQSVSWIVQIIFFLALIQTLSVVIKRTSILILVCIGLSVLISQLEDFIRIAIPGLSDILDAIIPFTIVDAPSPLSYLAGLLITLISGAAIIVIGNVLFARKEL